MKVHAADGSQVVGWTKDKDRRCTPWHCPELEVVDAASNDAGTWWDGRAKAFIDFLRGGARPPENPFFRQVRQLVDLNNDGRLSKEELDAALKKRAVARRLGDLIAYHTSEWSHPGQATGKTNYIQYGLFVGGDTISNAAAYQKLESSPHAVLSAVWYWSEFKKLNQPGSEDDFLWCTAVINGIYNGYQDRLGFLNRAIAVLKISSCSVKNKSGKYEFRERKVYKNRRYSFAWGLWHDPDSSKSGVNKSAEGVIAGYRRYIGLHEEAGKPAESSGNRYWYGLVVSSYRDYAEKRVEFLEAAQWKI